MKNRYPHREVKRLRELAEKNGHRMSRYRWDSTAYGFGVSECRACGLYIRLHMVAEAGPMVSGMALAYECARPKRPYE